MASQIKEIDGIKNVSFSDDIKDDTQNSSDRSHIGASVPNGEPNYFLSDICDHYKQDPSFFW